jgi:DNA invertase Pin-like site-specific DNA recombinase
MPPQPPHTSPVTTIAYIYCDPCLEFPDDLIFSGWEIDYLYRDLGGRWELEKLILDCQEIPPDRLLLRSLIDLGDSLTIIGTNLRKLEGLGIEIIALKQDYRSSRSQPLELAKLWQEIQQELQQQKLKRGHAKNRLKTLPPPGKAPYGYRRGRDKYIIDRSTAPVVKEFFDRFLLFGSLRGAVRFLETRYGKKISVSTGQKWLTNPVYRGNLIYQKETIIPATHTAIISPEEAAQIDRLLRRNSRLPPRTASAPRSLAGLVICDRCRSSMKISRVTQRGKKQEYLYLCPVNCALEKKCSAISYQEVLHETIERICIDLPAAVANLNASDINSIKNSLLAELEQKQDILNQINNLKQSQILDENTANLRSYQLRSEIARLDDRLAALPPANLRTIVQTVSLPQFWLDLSETERRFYFREFLQKIAIVRSDSDSWQLQLTFVF